MLSTAFWEYLAAQDTRLHDAALGFMRTYTHLVRHESDFQIAKEKGLIRLETIAVDQNKEDGLKTFDSFTRLISSFDHVGDDQVSPRYTYGELRLTRLNFYARILLRKLTYHHIEAQWGTFLGSFFAPFLVVFGVATVILNAMQVGLAALGAKDIELR